MIDREFLDPLLDLPPDLAALDAELSGLKIEERASYAPELEAELRRLGVGSDPLPVEHGGHRRVAVAACLALLLATFAVPPARGSLVMLMGRLQAALPTAEAEVPVTASEQLELVATVSSEPLPMRSVSAVGAPIEADPFRPVRFVAPRAVDPEEQRSTIRRFYPPRLQESGIGGIVTVLVYVDSVGAAHQPQVDVSSGKPQLDAAALQAAPRLRFRPATRDGRPFSTWVRFNVVFEPLADVLPVARAVERPELPAQTSLDVPPEWTGYAAVPAPIMQETLELLRAALGDDASTARLGTLERVVHGEPPIGADPLQWRAEAARALEGAMLRAPDNPAPFLALARIRRKQGLPADARELLERGIRRARQGGFTVSPRLTAELNFELAVAARDAWYTGAHLGRLPAEALTSASCERARVVAAGGEVSPETLIAWNYLCPEELRRVLDASFEDVTSAGEEREVMLRSLRAAVTADPGHVGANVELLLDLAERDDGSAVLNGARRFGLASGGHPYAHLLAGLALNRMGHSEDALGELEAGLAGVSADEAARIRDISPLLDVAESERLQAMDGAGRASAESAFWAPLDPIASTDVNERYVSHLARSAYAHLRLGGGHTDAGDVWVRYGEPLSIRAFGDGTALRTELWDYGSGAAVTFRRPAASAALGLTPEAHAYLEDLRATQPFGGATGRSVAPLEAEVSRFRTGSGSAQVEITTRIPAELMRSDQLVDVALVQLDRQGARVAIDRQKLAPTGDPIRLHAEAKGAAAEIVVDFFSPSLEQVATLRTPFDRSATGGDPLSSDLELTTAVARPRREVDRGARWVEPLADHRVSGAEVGVLFELYDLPGTGSYTLRVELVPARGGPARTLEFRPAGETRFGTSFTRVPWAGPARATEYLSARLAGVPAGSYTLRIVAEPTGGRPIVVTKAIERR